MRKLVVRPCSSGAGRLSADRRTLFRWQTLARAFGLGLLTFVAAIDGPVDAQGGCASNPIVCENALPGHFASEWDVTGAGDQSVQGFATEFSVVPGQTQQFKIDTAASNYTIDIYRMGYYNGRGARRVATLNVALPQPQNQPDCLENTTTGLIDCGNWGVSASWLVPADAVSGIYFARPRLSNGDASHIFFVVRDDSRAPDLLFQTSDTTWQAYNTYGGNSLYVGGPETNPGRATKVSYNRPFATRGNAPEDWVFNAEYPMVRWLEANGYDVSYMGGADTDRFPAKLIGALKPKVFLSVGHDEYWSGTQRTNVEAARTAAVHLAFFSGNAVFWKTRWETSIDASGTPHRTLVSYKETHANAIIDPDAAWTGTWRDPRFSPPKDGGRPENGLMGTSFRVNSGTTAITVPAAQGKHRFWRHTSIADLQPGTQATLPDGTLGYEWDEAPTNAFTPPGLMRLSSTTSTGQILLDYGSTYGFGPATHSLTLYRHPSGALVFGGGTIQWSWGLDDNHDRGNNAPDDRMKQATVNLFKDMGVDAATLEPGLTPPTASSDLTAPTSIITSPSDGASFAAGAAVTISGTAADNGGIVTAVEVSVDGGVTWIPATGTNSWTLQWTASGSGTVTIQSRAFDDTGNAETPGPGVQVTVGAPGCPCTLWGTTVPPTPDSNDAGAVELGTRFRADTDGFITGVRFYKASLNTGTHVGRLWSSAGALLGSVTFNNETPTGWQVASFPSPIAITANTNYVVSYHAPNGRYSASNQYFASSALDNPPLHAPQDGINGSNGVYRYGAGGVFPTSTFQSSAYWVDPVFVTTTSDSTPPTITTVSPTNGATGVDPTTAITATFSEAMNPDTISTTTFELRDPANALVASAVSYNGTTNVATLQPTSPLAVSTTYSVLVRGGAAEPRVKDLAGNALAASVAWSFTTATAPPPPPSCPCTIWTADIVPATIDTIDGNAVEIGTRFRADVAGFITGARFYKAATNTGTHVAKLWSNGGTLLGSATFVDETSTGWQETAFASPIAIAANTTYVISYHAPNGHYSSASNYFATSGVDRPPLHGLGDGVDGANGVFVYGPSGFPTDTFQSTSYFVDVVFNTTIGPDTTPPVVTNVAPPANQTGVSTTPTVTATFNEAMTAGTINPSTFLLHDPLGTPVQATVTYSAATRTATLTPTPQLDHSTTYTAIVKGGATDPRVKDAEGNALASDFTWSFTTAAPPPPPPSQGPGGPVLVITSASNPFTTYLAEILRTEGLNAFLTADISTVSAATLSNYDVVILGAMPLTAGQVSMLDTWTNQGGNLIAMRPDKQLAGLFGLTDSIPPSTLSDAYLLVNTATAPGAGIVNQTIQFHGAADRYTLNGATPIATLYSTSTTPTSPANPAVTIRSVGANGGQAVAFTYDLARSVVYTRQGNPAWSGQERDGVAPIRPDDLYFGGGSPDWVDLNKVDIPQADEQQRLLFNTILHVNADRKPLPRFWYFPRMLKAVVVMTGDDHGNGGTAGRFDHYLAISPANCSVNNWECIRGTSYVYPNTPLSAAQISNYVSQGFEIALHVTTNCSDFTPSTLAAFYSDQLAQFAASFPGAPTPATNRTHCIAWSDYDTQPQVELSNGIRLDTSYYYWPGSWILDRPGMFTGSGLPMRYATSLGQMIDVFQAATQMTDESGQSYPLHPDELFDRALGPEGYYGAFTANMHTDFNPSAGSEGSDAIIASAQTRGVPVVSSKQMLDWLDGRNGSSFGSITWAGNVLSFDVAVGAGANGLYALVPATAAGAPLTGIARNGTPVSHTVETIKGVSYAVFVAQPGAYQVTYGTDVTPPAITNVVASPGSNSATITWNTDEGSDSRVDYGTDPNTLNQSAGNAAFGTSHSVTLTGLASATTYYYRVSSADGQLNLATSPPTQDPPATFTTTSPALSIANASVLEGNSGTTNLPFTVTLSAAVGHTVTVDVATTPGTASAGSDYASGSGTLTFAPGVTTQTFNVGVVGDTLAETDETFTVTLSNAVGASLGQAQGTGTILNDEALPSITIGNSSVTEGNAGVANANFNVTLSAASASTVTVQFATAGGTATADSDFVTTSGSLQFDPGVTQGTITVPLVGDLLNEADEQYVVNLSGAVNATIADSQGAGTIVNDDALPTVSIADASGNEGQTGTSLLAFNLTLSAASGQTVTVSYATANGTATAGTDYVAATSTATFTPGQTTVPINITINGDTTAEADEQFVVNLTNATNATIADGQATGGILNDDGVPALSITDVTVTEGNTGSVNATLTVSLSPTSAAEVTVAYATADISAAAGTDYTSSSGTLSFASGITTRTIVVPVLGDTADEINETLAVNLSAPTNATIADAQGIITITDNDATPSLAVANLTLTEGNDGTVNANVNVSLSAASGQIVTVAYATANGTATAGADYTSASGTLTFPVGVASQTVTIPVAGDVLDEANETIQVNISTPTNATIADAQGIVTITDDDDPPTVSVADVALIEGNSGTKIAAFNLTLSAASGRTITVRYGTANGTAVSGSDYVAVGSTTTLTFQPGTTTATANVTVNGDLLSEADETFAVNLNTPTNVTIADGQGIGTIQNDDALPNLTIGNRTVTEGDTGAVNASFTVTLSPASGTTVTVNYATVDGTAAAGSDFVGATGTVSFTPGATSRTILIPVSGDLTDEINETYTVKLSVPVNANITDDEGLGTINDNDPLPSITISDLSLDEGNSGQTSAALTLTLSRASGKTVSVAYATANGSAIAGSDYVAASGAATFQPGVTSVLVPVNINGDTTPEANESFVMNLSGASNATIARAQGVGVILNDDGGTPPPAGLVAAYGFEEGAGTTAADASGNGHIATISGATWTPEGRNGNALSFDGVNDMASVADSAALDITRMTIMAWVRPSTLLGYRTALIKETGSGLAYALYAHSVLGRPQAYINTGGNDILADGTLSLSVNTWAHLAATYDGSRLRLYVNGALVRTRTVSGNIVSSTQMLRIGGNTVWGEFFGGLIDDVRVYNRALSQSEIQTDMNVPVP